MSETGWIILGIVSAIITVLGFIYFIANAQHQRSLAEYNNCINKGMQYVAGNCVK